MNGNQKKVLIVIAVAILGAFLYAPYDYSVNNKIVDHGYEMIWDMGSNERLNVATLALEFAGILIIGTLMFFIFKDND
jgi:hypothetical protein